MQKLLWVLISALLIGCTPAECSPAAPLALSSISGLKLVPDTTSVTLMSDSKQRVEGSTFESDYACPTFDLTNVTGQLGSTPLSASFTGGPRWLPPSVYSPYGAGGTGSGVCNCDPAVMRVEDAAIGAPISGRFDVTLSQGSTQISATYLGVSNSVGVVETKNIDFPPTRRQFRFFSAFDRTYVVEQPKEVRGPTGTNVKVVARYQGADVSVSVRPSSSPFDLVVDLTGPADEFTFEVEQIFHDLQPSDCKGATCAALRVIAPNQTLNLQAP